MTAWFVVFIDKLSNYLSFFACRFVHFKKKLYLCSRFRWRESSGLLFFGTGAHFFYTLSSTFLYRNTTFPSRSLASTMVSFRELSHSSPWKPETKSASSWGVLHSCVIGSLRSILPWWSSGRGHDRHRSDRSFPRRPTLELCRFLYSSGRSLFGNSQIRLSCLLA